MNISPSYYSITRWEISAGTITADLELNPEHEIFAGHFPGHPVLPGVCMIQIVKELVEKALGKETRLVAADRIKFLSLVDPFQNPNLQAEIEFELIHGRTISTKSRLLLGKTVCFNSTATLEMQI